MTRRTILLFMFRTGLELDPVGLELEILYLVRNLETEREREREREREKEEYRCVSFPVDRPM